MNRWIWQVQWLWVLVAGSAACMGAEVGNGARLRWGAGMLDRPDGWYRSEEALQAARSVMGYQSAEGGWPKNHDLLVAPGSASALEALQRRQGNTLDNGATTLPLRFLARVVLATGDEACKAAVVRGVDYLLAAQYENGGFPQYFPLRAGGYYSQITFNDNAMVNVLGLLREVAAAEGGGVFGLVDEVRRVRARGAVERGVRCILATQVRQEGQRTAWCAQHDVMTLAPAWGRSYEPPSLSGSESVGVVRFLMGIANPSEEVVAAVEGAMAWLKRVAIRGVRVERFVDSSGNRDVRVVPGAGDGLVWARFYELGSDRALFMDRDSVPKYRLEEIGRERRGGYAYYGDWGAALILREYPEWKRRRGPRVEGPGRP